MQSSEFEGVKTREGVHIWRVNKFTLEPVRHEDFGVFFSGDSYLVLVCDLNPRTGKFSYSIHIWKGEFTSIDEPATAAFKATELSRYLGGKAVVYSNTMGSECEDFLKLFPLVTYGVGGHVSGFRDTSTHANRLFHVKRENEITRVFEVPCERESLNNGDAFVLETKSKVFQWCGQESDPFEKVKSLEVAQALQKQRSGVSMGDSTSKEFWECLGGKGYIHPAEKSTSYVIRSPALFRLSDASGKMVFTREAEAPLKYSMLDTDDVFLVDLGSEIIVWIGNGATENEKSEALTIGDKFLAHMRLPKSTPVSVIKEDQSTNSFSKFVPR